MRILTRTIWLLSLVSLFTDLASELLYPVMPVYLKSIGFTVVAIGVLEGIAELVAGLSKGYFGQMADATGKRVLFVRLGYALSAVSKMMLAAFTSVGAVFIARLTDRLGKGARTSARDALLTAECTPQNRAGVFGFHRSMDTAGAFLGPIAALIYLWYFPGDYRGVILLAIFPGIVAVLITFILQEPGLKPSTKTGKGFFSYITYWKIATPLFKKNTILFLLFALINSSDVFLLLLLKAKGYSDMQMIGFYIFYNAVYALAAFPVGKLADAIGTNKILFAGLLLFAFVYIGINFTSSFTIIALLFALYGIYAACFESTSKAVLTLHCAKEETATAIGFYSGFASIAAFIASAWTGIIWTYIGSSAALITSGFVAFLVAFFFVGDRKIKTVEANS